MFGGHFRVEKYEKKNVRENVGRIALHYAFHMHHLASNNTKTELRDRIEITLHTHTAIALLAPR